VRYIRLNIFDFADLRQSILLFRLLHSNYFTTTICRGLVVPSLKGVVITPSTADRNHSVVSLANPSNLIKRIEYV
jgi:hypothetical protein